MIFKAIRQNILYVYKNTISGEVNVTRSHDEMSHLCGKGIFELKDHSWMQEQTSSRLD